MPALLQTRRAVLPLAGLWRSRLPQSAAIVARWSAGDIPAQTDNSALASWTDSVGGIAVSQATGASQPKYRTGGAGGKPYVLFAGSQYLNAGNSTNAVTTLLANASQASTSLVVFRNVQATTYGFLFSTTTSTGYQLYANGSQAGQFGTSGQRITTTAGFGTALSTICYTKRLPDASNGRIYLNNSCINHSGAVSGGTDVYIGGTDTAGLGCKAEIYEVIVWNRALSAAEVMQAEKWARDKYGSPYPWAGAPFRVFHGDSITVGQNATVTTASYPYQVAQTNGWTYGQWTNLGHGGASYTTGSLYDEGVSDIDPMVNLLGGSPLHLATFEWYNGRGVTNYQNNAKTYLGARKLAGVAKIAFGTSTDATDSTEGGTQSARAAYNAYWDVSANRAGYMDAYVPIHLNSGIGVEGACPNTSPYTPNFSADGIHLLDAGYTVLAGLFAPVMAGL